MPNTINFTKRTLLELAAPESGRTTYHDEKVKGLQLRVTQSGAKTFFIQKRVNGKPKRITIGPFPDMSVENARKEAQRLLASVADGIDPNHKKQADRLRSVTLAQLLEDFLARRALKDSSKKDYRLVINRYLPDWMERRIADISEQDVSDRYQELSKKTVSKANACMRYLRAMFNFAIASYRDESGKRLYEDNPVRILSEQRAWKKVKRRQTIIMPHDLPLWWDACRSLQGMESFNRLAATAGYYFPLLLLTGLRPSELAYLGKTPGLIHDTGTETIQCGHVDMRSHMIILPEPKGGDSVAIPLSDLALPLMRHAIRISGDSPYVFPRYDESLPVNESSIKHWVEKITEATGVKFTRNDLRRTFSTTAEALDLSPYTIKRLMGHATTEHDVTAGYIISGAERMRNATNQISAKIAELARLDQTENHTVYQLATRAQRVKT